MNGPQDIGGQMGFGPIVREHNEPVFHSPWQGRTLGLTIATGALGRWNLDEGRHARENLHPAEYYTSSYYEIFVKGLEALLKGHGLVSAQELSQGHAIFEVDKPARILKAEYVPAALKNGSPANRTVDQEPLFKVGDRVKTRNINPPTHTRLPRYARDKLGIIEAAHGGYVFPDMHAHGKGENPQHLYTVVFEAREIWGDEADPHQKLSIDAWESYLRPA